MPEVRVLCAADLHLGRRPAGLPGGEGARVESASAWSALVDRARAEAVDLVVLAGDVVDRLNRSFEAYGPLQRGIRALDSAGIPVVAVAGNHDHDVLHDVAGEVTDGGLRVLGRGGAWERWTLRDDAGRPVLHVDGWSFPDGHWRDDPAAAYDPSALASSASAGPGESGAPGSDVPVLGLLHCDLDQPGSPYAPVTTAGLRSLPVTAWVLGHVHAPRLRSSPGAAPILYPGSLQALGAGEPGPHGAWILELGGGGTTAFRRVPLSATRYETVDVDLEGIDDVPALNAAVRRSLQRHLDRLGEESTGPLRVVVCRVHLTGRTALHGRVERALEGLDALDLADPAGLRLVVDPRVVVDTAPALDLESLARGTDAPAMLARLLLGGADAELRRRASRAAAAVTARSHYAGAGLPELDADPDSERVADALRRQAGRLLDAVMAGKGAP
jgi:exonuclease SbcD